jgi:predicted DCC family thiol-disulfide oxidoreductase YuxK
MPAKPQFPLRIFYDGSCFVCSSEIEHYGQKDKEGRLLLVDISSPDFNPDSLGIVMSELMYQLHAIDQSGRVYRGVEAFWAIWQAYPASTLYGFLGTLITLPVVNAIARFCYKCFARFRIYLPKRTDVCSSGTCRIGKDKPG